MKLYRLTYKLGSAVASEWHSDTFFGHLCWALRYLEGEKALVEFLEAYQRNSPPLIISSGFPGEFLPNPLLPPSRSFPSKLADAYALYRKEKARKEVKLISLEDFNKFLKGEEFSAREDKRPIERRVILKNQLNRLSGATGEKGNLYNFEEIFLRAQGQEPPCISFYVKLKEEFKERAERLFNLISEMGYGKRKSAGYGEIKEMDFKPFSGFKSPQKPNGFIILSNFIPAKDDPKEGSWRAITKYGKLGEGFASYQNPFKQPLVMFTPGSIFYDSQPKEWYGRMVKIKDIGSSHIVQYGLAFSLPARLPER